LGYSELVPTRRFSGIEAILTELAWVNEPVDPNVCGCRHVLCGEREGHAIAKCPRAPTRNVLEFQAGVLLRSVHWIPIRQVEDARIHDGTI